MSRNRSSSAYNRLEVKLNVYELLPPGKLSSCLWAIGSAPLHTGIVIKDKEYAYGGHDQKGVSGVYWTRPRTDPPGGTFKCELLQGITLRSMEEIDLIVSEAAFKFQGPAYNLLTNNCNHFTSYLCLQLTGKPAPSWLNRAASIGQVLPCLIPRAWVGSPPDAETADGQLVDEDDERTAMLGSYSPRDNYNDSEDEEEDNYELSSHHNSWHRLLSRGNRSAQGSASAMTDSSGRALPVSERAPTPNG